MYTLNCYTNWVSRVSLHYNNNNNNNNNNNHNNNNNNINKTLFIDFKK